MTAPGGDRHASRSSRVGSARRRSSRPTRPASSSTGCSARTTSRRSASSRAASPDVAAIDDAMRGIGFRLGPFELADVVGTDVNLAAGIAIFEGFFGDAALPARDRSSGRWSTPGGSGARSSAGYYDYGADGDARAPGRRSHGPRRGCRSSSAAQIEARILAAIVNEAASAVADGGRDARRDRHRHAARHELAGGPAGLGRAHRPGVGGPHASTRCTPRCRTAATGSRRCCAPSPPTAAPSSPRGAERGAAAAVAIGPSSSTWTACCSTPRRSGTRPRPSSFARHGDEFTWDDKMAVIGTSFEFTARYFADRLGRPRERGAGAGGRDGRRSCTSACDARSMPVPARWSWSRGCGPSTACASASPRTRHASWSTTRWRPPA